MYLSVQKACRNEIKKWRNDNKSFIFIPISFSEDLLTRAQWWLEMLVITVL